MAVRKAWQRRGEIARKVVLVILDAAAWTAMIIGVLTIIGC